MQEGAIGRGEGDDHGARIGRGEAREVRGASLAKGVEALDEPVVLGARRRNAPGVQQPLPAVPEVVGGDGLAVGERDARAEVERVRASVGGDLPALGEGGNDVGAAARVVDQPLVHEARGNARDGVGGEGRVDGVQVRVVGEAERSAAVRGGAAGAAKARVRIGVAARPGSQHHEQAGGGAHGLRGCAPRGG